MDSDLWIARLAAAKRHYTLQQQHLSQSDRLGVDEFEVEEDVRADLPCPYCYEDHDITSLCSHLEDEHPFESKAAICPICSVKVASDMLSHITLQHGHQFKISFLCIALPVISYRIKLRRVAIPSSQALSLLGRDLREAHLQVLLGSGSYRSSNTNASATTTDSLLSSLVLNFPSSEAEETSKSSFSTADDFDSKLTTSSQTWKSSSEVENTTGPWFAAHP
ncbi:hypothetical protein HPP92_003881 [Vanilla planifolia]|uniref:Drought induced 19 protein type zinc-binding domain-containing protein n=1 Tax=Vanilla planifolia TaxID=51239 RepID=A0A835RVA2_VANPL|nr:hypothetical protein HPP92_003881 [Vanilla planifolia]